MIAGFLIACVAVTIGAAALGREKIEYEDYEPTFNDYTPDERIVYLANGQRMHLMAGIDGSEYVVGMSGRPEPEPEPERPNEIAGLAEAVRLEIARQQNEQAQTVMSGWGCFDEEPEPEPEPERIECWADVILQDAISQAAA